MFQSIKAKVSQSSLIDFNRQIGRIKDTVISESSQYMENFSSDARKVSELIRSESGKINEQIFSGRITFPTLHEDSNTSTKVVAETRTSQGGHQAPVCAFPEESRFIDEEDNFLDQNQFTYFVDEISDSDEIESDDSHVIQTIARNSKNIKFKKLRQKVRNALDNCKINAQVEADTFKEELMKSNPVNEIDRDLEQANLTDLQDLEKALEIKIFEMNTKLLQLIEEKDRLEQGNAEGLTDVKDLVSIM